MPHSIAADDGGAVAAHAGEGPAATGFWALTLGSIGVVYGDIGTSPLYALRESVLAAVGPNAPASEPVVLGILSLIIWSLLLVVTAK
jgi:KUP system potassium uptake protein